MTSSVKQPKATQIKRYIISDMIFQSKKSFYLILCIDKNLASNEITAVQK